MTTLRLVVDQLVGSPSDSLGRYTADIARALIVATPKGCDVQGITASAGEEQRAAVRELLPGLSDIGSTQLASRELALAWKYGVGGSASGGLIHSPSLLAPLRKHDRASGTQVSVTVHDVLAWTQPDSRSAPATRSLMQRARKHADAIVVRSHAVAEQLAEIADFGDRIRVIPGAGRFGSALIPSHSDTRAKVRGLPDTFIVAEGAISARSGIGALVTGWSRSPHADVPLVIIGADPPAPGSAAELDWNPAIRNLHFIGEIDDDDRATVLARARAFVYPSLDDGFGAPMLDALTFGLPVVHSDAPALVELSGGSGFVVPRDAAEDYPERLGEALSTVMSDEALSRRMGVAGEDRSKVYSWRDAGERLWQLHADL